ncbi:MAG: peptidase T [Tissierellaceae bacterium]
MSKVIDRFLKYVSYDTCSDESSTSVPSTPGQMEFAKFLAEELEAIGLSNVTLDHNGYIMATLPANTDLSVPTIGFIAHMDTSPDMSGKNVNPRIVSNYDGQDIILNPDLDILMEVKDFPELKDYIGKDLIVTDGTTLLGADNKAGIAEIVTAMEYLIENPHIPHGTVKLGFTPDEEIGRGADHFDVDKFAADFAYTVDGGPIGELEYENFNAATAKIHIQGRNVHPGTAKDKMINSILVASELNNLLPVNERPEYTEGYEGFYHLISFNGSVEKTEFAYIIRDHSMEKFNSKKETLEKAVDFINHKYGNIVSLDIVDSYYNMREKIEPVMHVIDLARQSMEDLGISPLIKPIRGGTDGARLSYMGLPCPNLFTGGLNFHGKFEYIPTFAMDKAVETILKIIELAQK